MNENKSESKKQTGSIIGMIVLIIVLFCGIKLVFALLGTIVPENEHYVTWYQLYAKDGSPSAYHMRLLEQEEREAKDVQEWLKTAQGRSGDEAYLLWLKDTDQYIFYLPMQDRAVAAGDITATEELDGDGELALVLRVRTAEDSEEIDPAQQLPAVQTTSKDWNGIRIKLVLDGREVQVNKCVSTGGNIFSSEETYMGRK